MKNLLAHWFKKHENALISLGVIAISIALPFVAAAGTNPYWWLFEKGLIFAMPVLAVLFVVAVVLLMVSVVLGPRR